VAARWWQDRVTLLVNLRARLPQMNNRWRTLLDWSFSLSAPLVLLLPVSHLPRLLETGVKRALQGALLDVASGLALSAAGVTLGFLLTPPRRSPLLPADLTTAVRALHSARWTRFYPLAAAAAFLSTTGAALLSGQPPEQALWLSLPAFGVTLSLSAGSLSAALLRNLPPLRTPAPSEDLSP